MTSYRAPVADMRFVINELAPLATLNALPGFADATSDVVDAVLEARFAEEVLAPLNKVGDREGCQVVARQVVVAAGFKEAYGQFVEGGWNGLAFSPDYEGQGLPTLVGTAVEEMWHSANMAFALCPMLTQGAVEAMRVHANTTLKARYLTKMVTGEWTGTMNLTEPQAGSDLAAVRAKALPDGDGYRLYGQKIYITWGDHNATDNIVHLVLARLPDAPEGTKGISLFLVPKYLVNDDGTLGARNDVYPVSVEHKLGIHASPTCVMSFGDGEGALGYLVGEPNRGLACMFTMMNHARIAVGLQGLAIAERAYQQARAYALDRVQGIAPGRKERGAIIHHPDVRRMLMLMKGYTEAMRAVTYVAALHMDMAHMADDPELRQRHQQRLDLLTPVVKGWCTEIGQELTSLGIQIHGGMGYVEETGAAQHLRDARITTIYEGTTGIQAQDFAGRKILRDEGAAVALLLADMRQTHAELTHAALVDCRVALGEGITALEGGVEWLLTHAPGDPCAANAVAVELMMLTGTVLGSWQMAKSAAIAQQRLEAEAGDPQFWQTKLTMARFYARHIAPRAECHRRVLQAGSQQVMALAPEQF